MIAADRSNQTEEVRRSLVDPARVAQRLGLGKDARRQSGGVLVRCPAHREKTPSCSITVGPDGTLRVRCFGCGLSGDCLTLVAAVRGLDVRRDFRDVLAAAAEVGGLHELAAELQTGRAQTTLRVLPPPPEAGPLEREYPPLAEVSALWDAALPVAEVEPCAVALALRGLFPSSDVARALPAMPTHPEPTSREQSVSVHIPLHSPQWARYQGRSWFETGHRVIVPMFDHTGELRSVRAWRITSGETPKRLPPAGHRASGLVLANEAALRWLRAPAEPLRLLVVEGEPDALAADQSWPGVAVVGIGSGSWSNEFAARVPLGSEVAVHTHDDDAGRKYAEHIKATLAKRAVIIRGRS